MGSLMRITPAPPLRTGDRVACVAASSALQDDIKLQEGIAVLQSWGLDVQPQTLASRRWGYFAGRDDARHADLHPAEPAALLACARGGWGAARLLEQPIRWQSGWLLGFSDVTALLWARQAAGFAGGIHGPLLTTLAEEPQWSRDRLRNLLFGNTVPDLQGRGGGGGVGSGPLLVANLTVATHLLGSRFVPPLKGAVLVLEDVGEAPYRIDRMLTQWRLNGSLQGLAGLAFGNFEGCADETRDASESFNLEQVLEERTADLGIPRVMDLPVGHRSGNAALPMGAMARLDGENGRLSLLP